MTSAALRSEQQALKDQNYSAGTPSWDLLDAGFYDSTNQLFMTVDGALWRIWEIPTIPADVISDEQKMAVSDDFAGVLNAFPEGSGGQFLRISYSDIRKFTNQFLSTVDTETDSFAKDIAESIVRRQLQGATQGFFSTVDEDMIQQAKEEVGDEFMDADQRAEAFESVEQTIHTGEFALVTQLFVAFRYEPPWMHDRIITSTMRKMLGELGLIDIQSEYQKEIEKGIAEFNKKAKVIQDALNRRGFEPRVTAGQGLVDVMFALLNPSRALSTNPPTYNPTKTIREHVMSPGLRDQMAPVNRQVAQSPMKTSPQGWEIDGYHYRVTSMNLLPTRHYPGMLTDLLGSLESEGWVTMNFKVANRGLFQAKLKTRKQMLKSTVQMGQIVPPLAPEDEVVERRMDDLNYVSTAVDAENRERQNVLDCSLHAVFKNRDREKAEEQANDLQGLMWDAGYRESSRGDAIIAHSLPLNFRPAAQNLIRRDHPMLSSTFSDLAPVYGAFSGIEDGILVNNTKGEPCFIDLFTSPKRTSADHALVVGGSGSGKSFLFNNLLFALQARKNPKIFLIDKGRSYEPLVHSQGGSYIDLVEEAEDGIVPTCLNPLYVAGAKPNKREMSFIRGILIAMIKSGTENEQGITETVNKQEQAILMEAVHMTFSEINGVESDAEVEIKEEHEETAGNEEDDEGAESNDSDESGAESAEEVTLSDFVERLKRVPGREEIGRTLADRLYEYTAEGPYGAVFDGKLGVDWSSDLIVFETERMADSPAMTVAMLCLFFQIETYIKRGLPRERKKIVAADEAWAVLSKPTAAAQIAGFYRELRKYGTSCVLISQSLLDFERLVQAAGGGILENTYHYFLLKVNSSQDYWKGSELLEMTNEEIESWRAVSSLPPFFSEVFYRMRQASGAPLSGRFRLYSNAVGLWTATTSPTDLGLRKEMVEKMTAENPGMDPQDAVRIANRELAKQYPFGASFA